MYFYIMKSDKEHVGGHSRRCVGALDEIVVVWEGKLYDCSLCMSGRMKILVCN